jgi:hypothetical protein
MAQNNDGPGKRLKREEAKNTLYVSRPDDPRLKMYQDSLALHNTFAGTNPIEINKTLLDSYSRDIKKTPSKNYAPLKNGPYGSALSKVVKTAAPPLNSNKLLGSGFNDAAAVYGGIVNMGSGTGDYSSGMGIAKSRVPDLIMEDETNKFNKRKRSFAPIGYQSLEHYKPDFVGDYWTTTNGGKNLVEQTTQRENKITPQQVRAVFPKISDKEINEIIQRETASQSGGYAIVDKNGKLNSNIYRTQYPNAVRSEGIMFSPQKDYITTPIYAKPQREVIFRQNEPAEPLTPRQATITPSEIVPPVVRPVPQSNLEPQDGAMGFALRYPAQNFINRVKARITGQPNMPYWVDREGVKRYQNMGENRPEEVRMAEMLKSNLNSNNPEDAAELKRIDLLRKMSPKDRRRYMDSESFAQE